MIQGAGIYFSLLYPQHSACPDTEGEIKEERQSGREEGKLKGKEKEGKERKGKGRKLRTK